MLGEIGGKFGPAARVLVLELHARRADAIGLRRDLHAGAFDQRRGLRGLVVKLLALAGLGAIAAAGDDQRQGALGIGKAEMQGRKPAHRDADDVRLADRQRVEHGADVVAGAVLRIARGVFGHIGRRVAARIVGDAAVAPPEIPHLRLVAAVIVGEFVDEHDRRAGAGLLVIEADAVIGGQVWHRRSLCRGQFAILGAPACRRQAAAQGAGSAILRPRAAEIKLLPAARLGECRMNSEKQRQIEQRAYALWQAEGRPHGKHEEHWRRAAREIEAEETAARGREAPSAELPKGRRELAQPLRAEAKKSAKA